MDHTDVQRSPPQAEKNSWEANDPFHQTRPPQRPRATSTKILQAVSWGVFLLSLLYAVVTYLGLPAEIPTHFNVAGQPDAWGAKSEGLISIVVLTLCTAGCLVLARFPRIHNVPVAPRTEAAWQRAYTVSTNMLLCAGVGCALILIEIMYSTAHPERAGMTFLVPLAVMIIPLIVGVIQLVRINK